MPQLILPGSLAFDLALSEIPPVPDFRRDFHREGEGYLISRPGSFGLLESVTRAEWLEYVCDGELDARQSEIEELDSRLEGVIY